MSVEKMNKIIARSITNLHSVNSEGEFYHILVMMPVRRRPSIGQSDARSSDHFPSSSSRLFESSENGKCYQISFFFLARRPPTAGAPSLLRSIRRSMQPGA